MKIKISKEGIEQSAITAVITLIVAAVGFAIFGLNVAVYSGIAAGLSTTVGKEYGDSLIMEDSWHWRDAVPALIGVIIGLLLCLMLRWITSV